MSDENSNKADISASDGHAINAQATAVADGAPVADDQQTQSSHQQVQLNQQDELLSISGAMTIATADQLDPVLAALDDNITTIDVSAVGAIDTVGAWLLYRTRGERPDLTITGLSDDASRLIEAVSVASQHVAVQSERQPFIIRELQHVGDYMADFAATVRTAFGFLGLTLVSGWQVMRNPRRMRWNSVSSQMEQTGVNALGIVGLMSFLVGIVIAQQGAVQLQQFGAEIFTINLIGRATFRELGILLTAIMVAGRSASAFAAQIGSMKLAEEIDAMRTIGLDPVEVLVLPRILALSLMMPLLAFYASICAIIGGGLFTWIALDIPPATYVQRIREVVPMTDFWVGMLKAPVFGAMIAFIGCSQGFQVSGNAESVGIRTTLAVVQAIFLVIVLDAFFAVFFTQLGMV